RTSSSHIVPRSFGLKCAGFCERILTVEAGRHRPDVLRVRQHPRTFQAQGGADAGASHVGRAAELVLLIWGGAHGFLAGGAVPEGRIPMWTETHGLAPIRIAVEVPAIQGARGHLDWRVIAVVALGMEIIAGQVG